MFVNAGSTWLFLTKSQKGQLVFSFSNLFKKASNILRMSPSSNAVIFDGCCVLTT